MPPKTPQPEFENGFRVDDAYLSRNLFYTCPVPAQQSGGRSSKPKRFLNTNFLPHLHQSIKRCFTPAERTSLKDHDVQTFLIECSLIEVLFTSVSELRDSMFAHINSNPHFWINGSEFQLRAKEQQAEDQHYQTQYEEWIKANPNSNPEDFAEIYENTQQPIKHDLDLSSKKKHSEEMHRIDSAMIIYNKISSELNSKVKRRFSQVKNDEYPEEYARKQFQASKDIEQKSQEKLIEKVNMIRPTMNFIGGFCDTQTIDQFSKQPKKSLNYRNNYVHYATQATQSSSISALQSQLTSMKAAAFDEPIPEHLYHKNLKTKNILVPDKYFKHPKIDFFMFPMIYQYVLLKSHDPIHTSDDGKPTIQQRDDNHLLNSDQLRQRRFRIQNFLFQLLLSDRQTQKKTRIRKDLFKKTLSTIDNNQINNLSNDTPAESQGIKQIDKTNGIEDKSEVNIQNNRSNQGMHAKFYNQKLKEKLIIDFSQFCDKQFNFDLESFISSIAEAQRREKSLLYNVIMLSTAFSKYLLTEDQQQQNQIQHNLNTTPNCNDAINDQISGQPQSKLTEKEIEEEGKENEMNQENENVSVSSFPNPIESNSQSQNQLNQPAVTNKRRLRASQNNSEINKKNAMKVLFSHYMNAIDTMDYFEVDVNAFLQFYVHHFENFTSNFATQLSDYISLEGQAINQSLIGSNSNQNEIKDAVESYRNWVNDPKTQRLRSYLYHDENRKKWNEEDYRRFLVLFKKYMKNPVNNRPIALEMGEGIHANHVRFEKQAYLPGMRKRAVVSMCTLTEQVQLDIDNFSMDFFVRKRNQIDNLPGSIDDAEEDRSSPNSDSEENDEFDDENSDGEEDQDDEDNTNNKSNLEEEDDGDSGTSGEVEEQEIEESSEDSSNESESISDGNQESASQISSHNSQNKEKSD